MNLVFLVSQPRSGSTFLQSVISNNSQVATTSEPWLLLPLFSLFDKKLASSIYNHRLAVHAISDFIQKAGGSDFFEEALRQFIENVYGNIVTKESDYFLDKTPRYYLILPIIKKILPNAKFIILKRHPFSVINSIMRDALPSRKMRRLYMHGVDILKGPLLMQSFLNHFRDDPNIMEVSYEKIVTAPEAEFMRIYEWLGIPWMSSVLDYSSNFKYKGKMGDQKGIQKHTGPNSQSLYLWKDLLKKKYWRNFFEGYANYLGADFLDEYGDYGNIKGCPTREFLYFQFIAQNNNDCECGITKNMFFKYLQFRAFGLRGEI